MINTRFQARSVRKWSIRFAVAFKITRLRVAIDGWQSITQDRKKNPPCIAFMYAVKRGQAIVRISHVSLNRHTSDDRLQL